MFGRLTVKLRVNKPNSSAHYFECECECGKVVTVRKDALYARKQFSCGCLQSELTRARFTTHGEGTNRTVEYDTWAHMIRRCHTPTTAFFENYGGRGITVCDRWRYSYENFLADMGRRPSAKHSLDRIDNDGNYEPSNCRWTTSTVQLNNTRRNHVVEFQGKTQTLTQWERELDLPRNMLQSRLKSGWPIEQAFTLPLKSHCAREIECKYCGKSFLSASGYGGCPPCQADRKREATNRYNARRPTRKSLIAQRDTTVSA